MIFKMVKNAERSREGIKFTKKLQEVLKDEGEALEQQQLEERRS